MNAAVRGQRDLFLAIAGGVAVGFLALTFPTWPAWLGIGCAAIAVADFARRRVLWPVGTLLIAAGLTAGLPTGYALLTAIRAGDRSFPVSVPEVFALAAGAAILGGALIMAAPDEQPAPGGVPGVPGGAPAGPEAAPAAPDPPDAPPHGSGAAAAPAPTGQAADASDAGPGSAG